MSDSIKAFEERQQIQQLPNWFQGNLYSTGGKVRNPKTGDSFWLTNVELSLYDYLKGLNYIMEVRGYDSEFAADVVKLERWFESNNKNAHQALIN
tara:strand:+ start:238 stop:522 length:285 start_codon:yes stop_codon:yes gene_type:complete